MANDPIKVLESMLARAETDKKNLADFKWEPGSPGLKTMRSIVTGRIGALAVAIDCIKDDKPLREMGDGRDVSKWVVGSGQLPLGND